MTDFFAGRWRVHALGAPSQVLRPNVLVKVFGLEVLHSTAPVKSLPVDGYPVVMVIGDFVGNHGAMAQSITTVAF